MRRLFTAVAASLAVIVSAPFVGQIRQAVQEALGEHYRTGIAAIVVGSLCVALAIALWRIRERRRQRYAILAAALTIGGVYAAATRSGIPEVDAVEQFHFVEYGVVALLFYRVWSARGDVTTIVLPVLAGFVVGTLDELFQWFVPVRVGEMRDVFLNGVALVCGVLFGIGVDPPPPLALLRGPRSRRMLTSVVAATAGLCAAFLHIVHLGHQVRVDDATLFLSRFTTDELASAKRDRGERWLTVVPAFGGIAREDQYFAEALWHVQERDMAWGAGDIRSAWRENLILERFYSPLLDVLMPTTKWPLEQRADAASRGTPDTRPFMSAANPFPIYTWDRRSFWTTVVTAIAAILVAGFAPAWRRRAPHLRHGGQTV